MEHRWSKRTPSYEIVIVDCPRTGLSSATMRNVSLGGMFIDTQCSLPVNTPIFITFTLEHDRHFGDFGLDAMVVHRTPSGVGLVFLNIPTDAARALRAALRNEPETKQRPAVGVALA